MQSIRSCNKLYLHYNLGFGWVCVQQMNDKGNLRIMLSNFLSLLCQINLLNLVSMWYSTYSQVHWRKRLIPALGPALAPGGGYPCILQSQPTLSRFNHFGFLNLKKNFLHFKTVFCYRNNRIYKWTWIPRWYAWITMVALKSFSNQVWIRY